MLALKFSRKKAYLNFIIMYRIFCSFCVDAQNRTWLPRYSIDFFCRATKSALSFEIVFRFFASTNKNDIMFRHDASTFCIDYQHCFDNSSNMVETWYYVDEKNKFNHFFFGINPPPYTINHNSVVVISVNVE